MPIDPVTGSLIIAGVSQGGNALSQQSINKKTRQWNEKMYDLQKNDNLALWNMQNSYNHPSQQMARLREAGLNPNLVYGHGADATAAAPQNATPASWNPRAPEVDGGAITSAYFNAKVNQAQTNNLQAQNDVLIQEAALKAAQTAQTAASTSKTVQDTQQASDLFSVSLDAAKANLQKTIVDTQYTLSENERRTAQTSSGLKEAAQRILESRARVANSAVERNRIMVSIRDISASAALKELDANLKRVGINPNDPTYMRILGQAVQDPKSLIDKVQENRPKFGKFSEQPNWFKKLFE